MGCGVLIYLYIDIYININNNRIVFERAAKESVEIFHLLFLAQLSRKLDKSLFAVKGGCNLRFFLGSVRYSEDLDLDIQVTAPETLRKKVGGILDGASLRAVLEIKNIAILRVFEPKQTETTQRWKLALRAPGYGEGVQTKIEFSRRGLSEHREVGPVDPLLIRRYGLAPVLMPHYRPEEAFRQKLRALSGRAQAQAQAQARDLFDIALLLDSGVRAKEAIEDFDFPIEEARAAALSLDFSDFKGQVGAYLDPDDLKVYDSPEVWDALVRRVVAQLDAET